MHLGNVLSALLSWLSARSQGGQWLLRIEDLDPQRSRREYALQLMDDLRWLGLVWDGEPVWQSQRHHLYEEYCQRLQAQGLTYPCYCTRADLLATQAPHESDGRVVYPGTCRPDGSYGGQHPAGFLCPAALRLMVPDEDVSFTDVHYGLQTVNLARHVGDFIIRRRDGAWAYQLAVVVDDGLMGVTEVVRGRDLLLSSPQQLYVARLLGFHAPRFVHLPLLCNVQGQRLSKRDRSLDMEHLRQQYTAAEVIGTLAHMAGLIATRRPVTPGELMAAFSWNRVPSEDIVWQG